MLFPTKLKVKTNQKETKIIFQNQDEIILNVKSPAEKNKANLEIIKFFYKKFKVRVKIVVGLKSKSKIIDKV